MANQKITRKSLGKILLIKNKNYKSNSKLSNLSLNKNKIKFGGNLMNAGVYYLKPEILNYIKVKQSLEKDILPNLINKKKINGYYQNSKFIDIGTYNNLRNADKFFKNIQNIRLLFFDRDGVINHDTNYLRKFKDLKLRPGAVDAIKFLIKKR